MTLLAPGFFLAALGVAAVVAALHFIVTRQPRAGILPTARFVPDLPATATARATRPSDLLLLLLRVLLVLAVGLGLARPIFKPARGAHARVILVDVSRASTDIVALRNSARSVYRDRDALILFDSRARLVGGKAVDSLSAISRSSRKGNLSAALIAAMRAASAMRERADSLELVIVSSLADEEMDAATDSIRRLWPGRARLVRLASAPGTPTSAVPLAIKTVLDDPLQVTVSLARSVRNAGSLLVRGMASPEDSMAASTSGTVLVEWPIAGRPRGTIARAKPDTIGGVVADSALVVAAFERKWKFTADSLRGAQVVARWIDGEPAAVEWPAGKGCIRSVALPVSPAGDLVIRTDFVRFVAAISGSCAGTKIRPMSAASVASLSAGGALASRNAFQPQNDLRSGLAPWLFALAIAAALAELIVRRRGGDSKALEKDRSVPATAAAA